MSDQSRKEKQAAYSRSYRERHPERVSKSNKAYYESNRDSIAKRQKAYREENQGHNQGQILRDHRRSLGLSQQKYAARLGVTQATLSGWERGSVPINVATVTAAFPELAEKLKGNHDG